MTILGVLFAIWEFLVAAAPLLEAIGTAIVGIFAALIELAKITAVITLILGAIEILFDPRGKQRIGNLLANIVGGGLGAASVLVKDLAPSLDGVRESLSTQITSTGASLRTALQVDFEPFVKAALSAQQDAFKTLAASTPENALDTASLAFTTAFGEGLSSFAASAAFEALLPEKLNTLNGIGPILAKLAGFDEVAGEVIGPLYKNAFGKSLEYKYAAQFKPDFPSESNAVEWHARRLDKGWKLEDVFAVSGLKSQFEEAYVASAYTAISVRSLIRAFVDVPLPIAKLRDTMEFTGNRPQDIDLMIEAMQLQSVSSLRAQYISAVMTSAERGTLTTQEVSDAITQSGQITDATQLAQLTIAVRKLEQLAEIYRKSITEAYTTGQITDAEYLPQLEAIGIAQADAEAHYAVDSIKVRGKQLSAEARAAARAAAALQRAQIQAALAAFRSS